MTDGLRLLLMENTVAENNLWFISETKEKKESLRVNFTLQDPAMIEKLQQSVQSVCLYNPFWNDFRLSDFFRRYGLDLTFAELNALKWQSGVGSRTAIYQKLLYRYQQNETRLSEQQIRFIERLNPAFRDRNLPSEQPGQLLIYECLSSRRLQHKFNGPMYLHLFIDRYNGYAFPCFHQERSSYVGLALLSKVIIPYYQQRDTSIQTILCSQKNLNAIHDSSVQFAKAANQLGVTWQNTNQAFGTIESFHKFILSHFFEGFRLYNTDSSSFETVFKRWLNQYNTSQTFYKQRNFLEFVEFGQCTRLSLD
jgi:hypothetical protein